MKRIPLEGKTINNWKVLEYLGSSMYRCLCSCGKEKNVESYSISSGKSCSCGCKAVEANSARMRKACESLIGTHQKAGRLTATAIVGNSKNGNYAIDCLCDCGNHHTVASSLFRNEQVKSCGCLRDEKSAERGRKIFQRGSQHPRYNPNLTDADRRDGRMSAEHKQWIKAIYKKDGYTCRACRQIGGNHLNAHHLFNWKDYPELRYSLDNGITLCESCHKEFHMAYGKDFNHPDQMIKFMLEKKLWL